MGLILVADWIERGSYEACIERHKKSGQRFQHVDPCIVGKPIIYLYPLQKQKVETMLEFDGNIVATYPRYDKKIRGWDVIANPDGRLINKADNKEYSYLFWEGEYTKTPDWDLSTGFVVRGSEVREFLQDTLPKLGLTPREYNEFVVYWYPILQKNPYNLIHFAGKEYTDTAKLTVTPKPDSILRVFMVYKPLSDKIDIKPQVLPKFERKGFAVVEWGGTETN